MQERREVDCGSSFMWDKCLEEVQKYGTGTGKQNESPSAFVSLKWHIIYITGHNDDIYFMFDTSIILQLRHSTAYILTWKTVKIIIINEWSRLRRCSSVIVEPGLSFHLALIKMF